MSERETEQVNRENGEVVYRRISPGAGDEPPPSGQTRRRRVTLTKHLAPALKMGVAGFAVLLLLVALLGYLSVRKLDEVGGKILEDERRHTAIRDRVLELRLAATKLDNEARARGRKLGEGTDATRPLFDTPLSKARDDLKKRMLPLAAPPYSEDEKWRGLLTHLALFVQATEDPNTYAREGYVKFRDADKDLDGLLGETRDEQDKIFAASDQLEHVAARRIYLMTAVALLMGALVAAFTIREMQRRFRQVRESMEETRREREFSAQMLEGMVSAVAAIDSHDRIRSANRAFFQIFPQAKVGNSVHDKFSSPAAMKMLESATSTLVGRATYRGRWVCDEAEPSCANKSFDVYSSPLRINDEQGQIVTLVDVTEAAEAEINLRRTEALAAMGQAVAQVAHEIKNPLGSIRLGVSMLRDTSTDEESLSTIDLVERGINHLNKLVVDVTQFSRQRPLELARVELHRLIDSSLELVADAVQEKHTPIERHDSGEPLAGEWDADQLRQVFVNLVANAIDASDEGAPVTITTTRVTAERTVAGEGNGHRTTERPQAFARVSVEDRGAGMDERTRAHLFEPFFTTKKRGTGLGLAIVKQIVEQHGGTISVESAPGQGTRFTVDLPMKG